MGSSTTIRSSHKATIYHDPELPMYNDVPGPNSEVTRSQGQNTKRSAGLKVAKKGSQGHQVWVPLVT
jgi:hypothetical protein